jgi:hypothetical protein
MRAPTSSFKSELEASLANLKRIAASLKFNDPEILPIVINLINQWMAHPDVEHIWNILREKLPPEVMPTAQQFIQKVIERRIVAHRLRSVINESQQITDKGRHKAKRHRKEGRAREGDAMMWAVVKFEDQNTRILGRQKNESPQKKFILGWRDEFRRLCGQPLDEVVADLTDIAFEQTKTREQVRDTAKPTTRRGRLRREGSA